MFPTSFANGLLAHTIMVLYIGGINMYSTRQSWRSHAYCLVTATAIPLGTSMGNNAP